MSISAVEFKNRIFWYDEYNLKNFSGLQYRKENEQYVSQMPGFNFSFSPNATGPDDPTTEILVFNYANGCKMRIEYRLYVTQYTGGEEYHLNYCFMKLYSKNETVIYEASIAGGTRQYTALNPIPPYSDCYFVPGYVVYDTNNPSILGEAASQIWLAALWIKKHTQIAPTPFMEESPRGRYLQTWDGYGFLISSNDEQYAARLALFVNGGDGTDPHGEGEGGSGDDPDPSGPGGGDKPTYGPDDGVPVDFPTLPTVSAFQTGMISAYKMSQVQLNQLAAELWSNNFFDTISKILNDPFDALISLSMLPIAISGSDAALKIGNYTADTHGEKLTAQFITVQAGSFMIPLAWNNFLDFTKTQISLYLPFVGIKKMNPDDVMGKLVTVQYNVDILTGSAGCFVKCKDSVLYSFPCNVGYSIPLTGSNMGQLYTGLINTAVSATSMAVMGGTAGAVMGAASGVISTATSKQSEVNRSGALSGNTGLLSEFNCYVIIHRPTQSLPANFKEIKGYKSNITKQLNMCRGFTKVDSIHLSVPGANSAELSEIESLLKEGVII